MHKILDHTSDLEIQVEADGFELIVKESILAITDFVSENQESKITKEIEIVGEDEEHLLLGALEEIVYLQSAEKFYVNNLEVKVNDKTITLKLKGGSAEVKDEIKAVTWHEFWVKDGKAHFICDL